VGSSGFRASRGGNAWLVQLTWETGQCPRGSCKEENKGQGGWRWRVLAGAAEPEGGACMFQLSIENWVGIVRNCFGCKTIIVGWDQGQQESNLEPTS
jgi:hypothetical protein